MMNGTSKKLMILAVMLMGNLALMHVAAADDNECETNEKGTICYCEGFRECEGLEDECDDRDGKYIPTINDNPAQPTEGKCVFKAPN